MVTIGQARQKLHELEPSLKKDYPTLSIANIGVSTLGMRKYVSSRTGESFSIPTGKTLDDLCLVVQTESPLPQDANLPKEYQGLPIYYEVSQIIMD